MRNRSCFCPRGGRRTSTNAAIGSDSGMRNNAINSENSCSLGRNRGGAESKGPEVGTRRAAQRYRSSVGTIPAPQPGRPSRQLPASGNRGAAKAGLADPPLAAIRPARSDRPAGFASGPGRPDRGSRWRPSRVPGRAGVRIPRGAHPKTGPVLTAASTSTAQPDRIARTRTGQDPPGAKPRAQAEGRNGSRSSDLGPSAGRSRGGTGRPGQDGPAAVGPPGCDRGRGGGSLSRPAGLGTGT